jgi:hypothetical protein
MSRKSTAYGRRRARLISAGHVLEKDGITMTQVNNTRLSPLEIERIIGRCKAALQALREARATHEQWVALCTARHVGTAIEDSGIVRGQRFLLDLGEAALNSIGDRCGTQQEQWTPGACTGPELSALADMIAAHSRQVHELTYGEYTRAAKKAVARVATKGGQIFVNATEPAA